MAKRVKIYQANDNNVFYTYRNFWEYEVKSMEFIANQF